MPETATHINIGGVSYWLSESQATSLMQVMSDIETTLVTLERGREATYQTAGDLRRVLSNLEIAILEADVTPL